MMAEGRISADDAALIRAEYETPNTPSLAVLERKWGWCQHAIARAITRAGGQVRPAVRVRRAVVQIEDAALLAEREQGWSLARLARRHEVPVHTIKSVLRRARRAEKRG